MRKILSIILTAAMTVSLFAAVPFSAEAAVSSLDESYVDFDGDSAKYYADNTDFRAYHDDIQIVDLGDGHGNTAKFTKMSASTRKFPTAIRLSTTDGNGAFHVNKGEKYHMSLDYKFVKADDALAIALKFIAEDKGTNDQSSLDDVAGAIPGYSKRYFWMNNNTDGKWRSTSTVFTAPCDGTVLLVPFNDSDKITVESWWAENTYGTGAGKALVNQEYYLDNIKLKKIVDNSTYVDFDGDSAKYYADNTDFRAYHDDIQIVDLGDGHGNTAKFTKMSASTKKFPTAIRLSTTDGNRAFHVNKGEKYQMSLDYKFVKADDALAIALKFIAEDKGTNDQSSLVDVAGAIPGYDKWYFWMNNNTDGKWRSTSTVFTAPCDGTVLLVPFNDSNKITVDSWWAENTYGDGAGKALVNQEYYLDNIRLSRATDVTLHNGALGDETVSVAFDTDLSDIKITAPAGAKFRQWYADAALTQPVSGKVGTAERELWATFETVTGDFENGNNLAKDIWETPAYHIKPYVGTVNSYAITDYKEGGTPSVNSEWPPIIQLLNPDGTPFLTYTDHEYKVEFDMKVDNPSLLPDGATLALLHAKPPYKNGELSTTYPMINDDSNTETKINFKYGYKNADGKYGTSGWYRHFTFNFVGLDSGLPVYVTPWQANTFTYFDNIRIIDVTAQKAIKDQNGYELARGYAGETVTINDPEAPDADFVYYADENGAPVSTTKVMSKDKVLYKVNSQIAVTGSDFNKDNSTVSFTTRFGGIGYTAANGGVTVKTIIVENTRYFVEDIGLLVAPTEKVTGELTLDNLCGATNISGTNLKYSATGTDELTITAQITTGKYDRDYTVVGYVKCAGGKVIYSKTRNSIPKSYNAAAGIESVIDEAHTKYNYTLVSNSEFNSAESLSNGWNPWGLVSNPSLTDATKPNCNYYSVESATYVDNGNLVLDLKRTGNNTYDLPEVLSKYNFKSGYLEVGARFAGQSDFSASIWLNSVALPDSDLIHRPNDTDIYVKPEIDIMESLSAGNFFFTLHNWGTPQGGEFGQRDQIRLNDKYTNEDHTNLDLTQYHIYGFERTSNVMRMYVDGKLYYELTYANALAAYNTNKKPGDYQYRTVNEIKAMFENPTYLILGAGGTQSLDVDASAISTIDYVRFYQ